MRKRRVGVTARSRLVVENQAIGTPQTATEMAAPLVSRTPMGTVATATDECGWKRGDTSGGKDNRAANRMGKMEGARDAEQRRASARMRHCLILRQGAKPPETPGPFPSRSMVGKGTRLSRVRFAGQKQAALDNLVPFRRKHIPDDQGKGPYRKRDNKVWRLTT
jgi:hypothetical protein